MGGVAPAARRQCVELSQGQRAQPAANPARTHLAKQKGVSTVPILSVRQKQPASAFAFAKSSPDKAETRPVRLSCVDCQYPIQSADGAAAHV